MGTRGMPANSVQRSSQREKTNKINRKEMEEDNNVECCKGKKENMKAVSTHDKGKRKIAGGWRMNGM